jgi:hypothetical protein
MGRKEIREGGAVAADGKQTGHFIGSPKNRTRCPLTGYLMILAFFEAQFSQTGFGARTDLLE